MSDLPQGWANCLTGDVAKIVGGGTPDSSDPENFSTTEGIAWLTPADLSYHSEMYISRGKRFLTEKGFAKSSARVLPKGAVLFSSRAPIGYVAIAANEITTNQGFKSFVCDAGIQPEYLAYYLKFAKPLAEELASGTTFAEISGKNAAKIPFLLPPLNEQRRIVAKLETLLGKVDTCQHRLAKLPRLLKRFRQAVLAAACSGRLTADWREKNQEVETASALLHRIQEKRLALSRSNKETAQILEAFAQTQVIDSADELPASWNGCQIGLIGTVANGSTPSRKVAEYWDGDIGWVSSGEVRNNQIEETKETISQKGFVNSSVRLLPPGTVLLAMIGEGKTRGQTAILKIEATINQNIAAIILNHGLVASEYLWHWFQFQYETTRESGSGSGPQALNCQRVRELTFHLPPLPEQQEIVRRVEAFFRLADQLEARYHKAKAHVDKLQQAILAKAFRGELVPQDPTDEPASVLLERIRAERATCGESKRSKARL